MHTYIEKYMRKMFLLYCDVSAWIACVKNIKPAT